MVVQLLIMFGVAAFALHEIGRLEREPEDAVAASVLRVTVGVLVAILGGLTVGTASAWTTAGVLAVAVLLIGPALAHLLARIPTPAHDDLSTVEILAGVGGAHAGRGRLTLGSTPRAAGAAMSWAAGRTADTARQVRRRLAPPS